MFFKLTEFLGNKKARLIFWIQPISLQKYFFLGVGITVQKSSKKKRFFSTTKKPLKLFLIEIKTTVLLMYIHQQAKQN